jgi:hypothetical protein
LLVLPGAVTAVEPADEFLKGLEARGLHEIALDYLEQMKTSPLVDDAFRGKIPFHRGTVLLEKARTTTDPAARNRLLDEARSELESFAQANPSNLQGAEAQLQLASGQMARGQELAAQVAQLPNGAAYDDGRQANRRDARRMFAEAKDTFERAEAIFSAELDKLPPTSSDDDKGNGLSKRQELRGRVAQLRYLKAQTQYETARSYPSGAQEYQKLLEDAAKEFSAIHDDFPRTLISGLARLYEGRCYQSVGSHQLALGCFEDVLTQPNVTLPFRQMIANARRCQAESFIAQEKYDAAIDACKAALKDASSQEERMPDWLGVRFQLAEAIAKKATAEEVGTLDRKRLDAEARDAYRLVANTPGEFQAAARTAIGLLGRETGGAPSGENSKAKDQPRSFQAAYDTGKDALASYNAAKLALPAAERNNPSVVPELQEQMKKGKDDARHFFRAATALVETDTDIKQLNEVRYFLCWLYWEAEDYYRAAVLGEFLARRFPDHPTASSSAKISMASMERLYNQALAAGDERQNTEFEARRMASMAEFITRRWPGTDDADVAFGVLVGHAIRNDQIEKAESLLGEASQTSRPRLELQLGNAMWGRYLELSQPIQAAEPDEAALAKLKQSAEKYLRNGLDAARKESQVSESAATAALYLAQVLLNDGEYEKVIQLLEDKQVGPLQIVVGKGAAEARPQFVIETYKAALRAYVSVVPPQDRKALETMDALEKAVQSNGGGAVASEQLTRIYIGLGVALQKQLEDLKRADKKQEADRVSKAFTQFLDRIRARQEGANWPTRVWLAQTYYNMGSTGRSDDPRAVRKPLSDADRENLTKARDAYLQLLKEAEEDSTFPPSEASVLAVRLQLGECQRALGQYQEALDTFSAILKEKETSLVVQRAAAYTYQERGENEDPQWLERAIHGGYQVRATGQNRIWGWLKISQVAARVAKSDQKYHDAFYEARVNVARCRYLAAMKVSGDERRQDLAKAKQSIQSLAQLYPELGGEQWRGQFDDLLKQIQSAAGQEANGLREFSAREPAASDGQHRRG